MILYWYWQILCKIRVKLKYTQTLKTYIERRKKAKHQFSHSIRLKWCCVCTNVMVWCSHDPAASDKGSTCPCTVSSPRLLCSCPKSCACVHVCEGSSTLCQLTRWKHPKEKYALEGSQQVFFSFFLNPTRLDYSDQCWWWCWTRTWQFIIFIIRLVYCSVILLITALLHLQPRSIVSPTSFPLLFPLKEQLTWPFYIISMSSILLGHTM